VLWRNSMYRPRSLRACSRVGYWVRWTRSFFEAAKNDSAQFRSLCSLIPISRADSAIGRDVSITNFRRFLFIIRSKILRFLDIFPFLQIPILVGS
jgi:hypothetical protein